MSNDDQDDKTTVIETEPVGTKPTETESVGTEPTVAFGTDSPLGAGGMDDATAVMPTTADIAETRAIDVPDASDAAETTVIPATLDTSNDTPTETMPPVGDNATVPLYTAKLKDASADDTTVDATHDEPGVIDAKLDDFAQTVPMTVAVPTDEPTAAIPRSDAVRDDSDKTVDASSGDSAGDTGTTVPNTTIPDAAASENAAPDAVFGNRTADRGNDAGTSRPANETGFEASRRPNPEQAPAWTQPARNAQPVVQVERDVPPAPQVIRKTGPNVAAIVFGVLGILLGSVTLLFGLDYPTNLFFWLEADPRVVAAIACAVVGGALVLIAIIWSLATMIGSRSKPKA
ncbi:hypothetical protein KIH79_07055 [Bifidobacterium sp. 82T10]|uniref:Uncharacterized protein n=1 Tax=Bifidobacterium miconis TaxID=2834435 RepID=A0ABS6WF87_9BIFI|nr:hypothetical protein [Bifidobacterium miconis]MBW3092708.1 hypothetical protein [Bifidobacterium miconis]